MPRILVLDEHGIYRTGLRSLIGAKIPRAEVIEASSLIEALPQIRSGAFDLVLVGTGLSDCRPLDSLKAAREASPATRFAVIYSSDTRADILASLAAGFHGFISKHQSDTDILAAITDILSGRIYAPWSLAQADDGDALGGSFNEEALPKLSTEADLCKLTKRQREVLSLLARGRSQQGDRPCLGHRRGNDENPYGRAPARARRTQPHGGRLQVWEARQFAGAACSAEPSHGINRLAVFRPRSGADSETAAFLCPYG